MGLICDDFVEKKKRIGGKKRDENHVCSCLQLGSKEG